MTLPLRELVLWPVVGPSRVAVTFKFRTRLGVTSQTPRPGPPRQACHGDFKLALTIVMVSCLPGQWLWRANWSDLPVRCQCLAGRYLPVAKGLPMSDSDYGLTRS